MMELESAELGAVQRDGEPVYVESVIEVDRSFVHCGNPGAE